MSRDVDFQKAVELSGEINHHVRVRQSLNTYRWKLHGIIKVLCDSLGDFEAGVEQHSAEITKLLSERDAIHAIFNDRFTPKVASGMIVAAKETASEECVGVRDEFTGSEEDASLIRGVSLIQHIVSGGIMDIPEVRDEKILRVPMPMLPRDLPTHAENSDIQSAMLAHSLWGAVRAAGAGIVTVEDPPEPISDEFIKAIRGRHHEAEAVTSVETEKAPDEPELETTTVTVVTEVEKDDGHPVAIELGEITSKDVEPEVLNAVNEATVLPPVVSVDTPRSLPDEPVSVETGENTDHGDFPVKASEEVVESDDALIVEPVRHDVVVTDDLVLETASTGHGVHTSTDGDVGAAMGHLTEDGAVDGEPESKQEILDSIGDTFDAAPSHKDDEFPFDTIAREQEAEQKDVDPEVPAVVEAEVVEKPAEPEPEKVETAVRKPKKISFKPKTKAKLKVSVPEAPPETVEPKPETSVADAAPATQDAPPVMDESEYGQDDVPENIPDDDEPEDVSGDDVMSQQSRPRLNIRRKPIFSN